MNILRIIMAAVFAFSAGYIIWCLYKATRYMREHPDEFNMSISSRNAENYYGEKIDSDTTKRK